MKNVRDAAVITLGIMFIKLVYRLIPPSNQLKSLFEYGIWSGIGIMLIAYIIIFVFILLILTISRRGKKNTKR